MRRPPFSFLHGAQQWAIISASFDPEPGDSVASSMTAIGAMATTGFRRRPPFSELDLLGDPQRDVDFYTEVANCAFQFRVSEKDLDGAQVARLL